MQWVVRISGPNGWYEEYSGRQDAPKERSIHPTFEMVLRRILVDAVRDHDSFVVNAYMAQTDDKEMRYTVNVTLGKYLKEGILV